MGFNLNQSQGQTFGPSGANHAPGLVPDPGSIAGTTRFLCEDGAFTVAIVTSVALPSNANAAAAGVPVNGLYCGTADPAIVYVRTA